MAVGMESTTKVGKAAAAAAGVEEAMAEVDGVVAVEARRGAEKAAAAAAKAGFQRRSHCT